MSLSNIKALTFDTGGTVLNWHSGFKQALEKIHPDKDWADFTNELRKRSLGAVLNLGETEPPAYTFDDAHRFSLEELLLEHQIEGFTPDDIHQVTYEAPHSFDAWEDLPPAITKLRGKYMVCSFTTLSYRMVIDTAKKNGIHWDCIFSCEGLGKYKLLPESYLMVANYLQLKPEECLMVACHNFDLDAARKVGFKTAYVKRPTEWGPIPSPDPVPNPECDIICKTFTELEERLSSF